MQCAIWQLTAWMGTHHDLDFRWRMDRDAFDARCPGDALVGIYSGLRRTVRHDELTGMPSTSGRGPTRPCTHKPGARIRRF